MCMYLYLIFAFLMGITSIFGGTSIPKDTVTGMHRAINNKNCERSRDLNIAKQESRDEQ